MPKSKAPKPAPEPVKEISEENRRLAEEFERALDTKLLEMDDADTIDVIPVEHRTWTGAETGCFSVEIPLEAGIGTVKQEDITMSLNGQILTVILQARDGDVTREIGKMLTLPEDADLMAISATLTEEGNLKIQAPISSTAAEILSPTDLLKPSATLALELVNDYRKLHGVGQLTLNPELCKLAETYAKAILKGNKVNLDESNLGRNIFKSCSTDKNQVVKEALSSWYDQNKNYNWGDPLASSKETQNFYEIIWKSSTFLGVGVEILNGQSVAVALYCRNTKSTKTNEGHKENVLPSNV